MFLRKVTVMIDNDRLGHNLGVRSGYLRPISIEG
jgi:hypothetical protein